MSPVNPLSRCAAPIPRTPNFPRGRRGALGGQCGDATQLSIINSPRWESRTGGDGRMAQAHDVPSGSGDDNRRRGQERQCQPLLSINKWLGLAGHCGLCPGGQDSPLPLRLSGTVETRTVTESGYGCLRMYLRGYVAVYPPAPGSINTSDMCTQASDSPHHDGLHAVAACGA